MFKVQIIWYGKYSLNLRKTLLQIENSCHYMPVSNYKIKLILILEYILGLKFGAHMCAPESLSNFKIT